MKGAKLSLADARESVCFDLDGVIIRSHVAIVRCLNRALRSNGLPEFDDAQGKALVGSPIKTVFSDVVLSADGGEPRVLQCVAAFRKAYQESFMDGTTLQSGMLALLEQIARSVPIAVATTKPARVAHEILTELGVRSLFTTVAGPDASADAETKETTLARAVEQLGEACGRAIDPRKSLMVGDRHHDISAARANGLPVVGVLWGYGSYAELAAADAIVEFPEQLSEMVRHGVGSSSVL